MYRNRIYDGGRNDDREGQGRWRGVIDDTVAMSCTPLSLCMRLQQLKAHFKDRNGQHKEDNFSSAKWCYLKITGYFQLSLSSTSSSSISSSSMVVGVCNFYD
ncbi:hypothetical protein EVAR_55714_1 [Eumeta japonica]|uniref:Uncharacterized protein n=1 Tax=Eumeta variegata TaxID=151549 RepID=A0A4C1YYZ6_EUMVA|nr:hypothetical protein EVAR_55714_1 [Eumeta japonica]